MPKAKVEIRVELVCTGLGLLAGKQSLTPLWKKFRGSALVGEVLAWNKVRRVQVGGIYSFGVPSMSEFAKGKIYTKSVRYERDWPNESEAKGWQVHAEMLKGAHAIERKAKEEEEKGNLTRKMLEPLRYQYQKSNSLGRAAIVGYIVTELERRGSFDPEDLP